MAVVEGVGNEVFCCAAALFVILLFYLGWVLLEPSPRIQHGPDVGEVNETVLDSETDHIETRNSDEVPPSPSSSSGSREDANDTTRQRRLDFFHSQEANGELTDSLRLPNGSPQQNHIPDAIADNETTTFEIRLKYLDETERTACTSPSETVADFKRANFLAEYLRNRSVRLIYRGQVLQERRTMSSYGLSRGCCVHVQVVASGGAGTANREDERSAELDLGQFLWPILGILLGVLWMFHFQYREYFATSSTVALCGLSGLFLTVVWSQFRQERTAR